jgi:transcriptional regulator with XRE-family HTH domain
MNLAHRLAERLRHLREEARISQVQMARRLGIGRSTLNRLEMASQNTTIRTLDTLCRALRCDIAELFPVATRKKPGGSRRGSD